MNDDFFDKIILGAGIYGLYAAYYAVKKGDRVLILEYDDQAFSRASYINQARLHNGYHYPRSFSTAANSIKYFKRFNEEFGFCVNNSFKKLYAIAKNYSWTNANQFEHFCKYAGIKCKSLNPDDIFIKGTCESLYETEEYTYDATLLKNYFLDYLSSSKKAVLLYNTRINSIAEQAGSYKIITNHSTLGYQTPFVLNATYSSVNQLNLLAGYQKMDIKYELCEVIICEVSDNFKNIGLTLLDGPFFSLMPFGKTGMHSLTAVSYTPHSSCETSLPSFPCQQNKVAHCSPQQLANCNSCIAQPKSSWEYMLQMSKKYLKDDIKIKYDHSLFSVKSVLKQSEVDDSRHTMIQIHNNIPKFVSILSGKVNTIYDLEEIL